MPTPISSSIILPADPNILKGAKNAAGISASGAYPPGNNPESTRYLALLMFGYEAKGLIPDEDTANRVMAWVYGNGGVDGLTKVPSVQALFSPRPPAFRDTDPVHVLQGVNTALENIAVPTIPDADRYHPADSAKKIIDKMNPPMEWYVEPELATFASSLLIYARRFMFPFLCVRLLGFLPELSPWSGYTELTNSAIEAATNVLGKGNAAINRTASWLIQCNTLRELADRGAYQYIPLDESSKTKFAETADAFTKFMSSDATAEIDKMKDYLATGYNNLDFGNISDAWNIVESTRAPAAGGSPTAHSTAKSQAEPAAEESPSSSAPAANPNLMPSGLDRRSYTLLQRMAVDEDQLMQALEVITSGRYYGIPYLTTYQPGITEKAIIQLLERYTDKASHKNLVGAAADPREKKTIMIPPAFKVDQSQAIWTKAVVTDLGFPFINFTSPPIMELIRGTDPKSIKQAYKQVKGMFKKCGLKKPIDTLKEFAHAQYRNCALNTLVVDADLLFDVEPGQSITASIIDPYTPKLVQKGSFALPLDFATAFYGVLSPVKATKQYCEVCGMSPEEYMAYLEDHGKPPVYILSPKRAAFKRGPKGGLLHELFSSKVNPILIRSRVGNHDGGFMIPERVADLLFSV
ncbi:MAG: hypothetical protein IKA48_02030 [Fibrobacter sp.]|nr:hypothetical protein [Fibrobacter sp.]